MLEHNSMIWGGLGVGGDMPSRKKVSTPNQEMGIWKRDRRIESMDSA